MCGSTGQPARGDLEGTPLDTILRNLGRDTVIVAGTLTNYCCGSTARQAYERGYRPAPFNCGKLRPLTAAR
ncbi:isochorismatase family protein [Nonomuraea sp. NPDC050153]|uniref:isochorismatase family protein n=1 Tax=Nonomuraea sp. NPDC050153 TaxID=3364359 RepID=UPI0037B5D1F4